MLLEMSNLSGTSMPSQKYHQDAESTDLDEPGHEGTRRVLLAGEHTLVLDMLGDILKPAYTVIAKVRNGLDMIQQATQYRPDIIIAETTAPSCARIEAVRRIREADPNIRVIFLTMREDPNSAAAAFALGASAYLLMSDPETEVMAALRMVESGGRYLSKGILAGDIDALAKLPIGEGLARISQRELEVLRLLVSGLPMKTVARRLGITARTVAFHKYKAMDTLGLKDNAELMEFAIQNGLLTPNQ